jgi:hypothetical protein
MSAKMTARLQAATSSGKPVPLRVDFDAGHGVGSTREQQDREAADVYVTQTGPPCRVLRAPVEPGGKRFAIVNSPTLRMLTQHWAGLNVLRARAMCAPPSLAAAARFLRVSRLPISSSLPSAHLRRGVAANGGNSGSA